MLKFNNSNLTGETWVWKLTGGAFPSAYIHIEFHWTSIILLKFNNLNLTGDTFFSAVRLEGISTRTRVWKLTGGAFPSTYTKIEFRWTPLNSTHRTWQVTLFANRSREKVSWPEWEFGSWQAECYYRIGTRILRSTELHWFCSNSTFRTWQVTLLFSPLLPRRYLNQNKSSEADGRSISVSTTPILGSTEHH